MSLCLLFIVGDLVNENNVRSESRDDVTEEEEEEEEVDQRGKCVKYQ
jgi:hypothetical protein